MKQFFRRLFGFKENRIDLYHVENYTYEKFRQEDEDRQIERDAEREGLYMYDQWIRGNILIIERPYRYTINNFYPFESKYSSKSYKELVKSHFEKLKHENNGHNCNVRI